MKKQKLIKDENNCTKKKGWRCKKMKHCGTKTIETDRLILRRFKKEDSENMFKNCNDSCKKGVEQTEYVDLGVGG